MKPKLYFSKLHPEFCYPLEHHKRIMEEQGLTKMVVCEAARETKTGYLYCKLYDEPGTKGNCGKSCKGYKPNNGKNGRCKHYGYCYTQTEKELVIEI